MVKKNGKGGVVTFTFDDRANGPVYLAGDFNKWNPNATPLEKKGAKWTTDLKLKPGEYQFKYYSNGNWYNDHKADKYVPSPFGGENSVVVL